MIKFQCPSCEQSISADEEDAGQVGSCPSCHQQMIVPALPVAVPIAAPGTEVAAEATTTHALVEQEVSADAVAAADVTEPLAESSPPPFATQEDIVGGESAEDRAVGDGTDAAGARAEVNFADAALHVPSQFGEKDNFAAPAAVDASSFAPAPAPAFPGPDVEMTPPAIEQPMPPLSSLPAAAGPVAAAAAASQEAASAAAAAPNPETAGGAAAVPETIFVAPSRSALRLNWWQAVLVALGFNAAVGLLVYSIWAEWGPYAWLITLRLERFPEVPAIVPFVLTVIVLGFVVLALHAIADHGGRLSRFLANGIFVAGAAVHLAVSIYFLVTGSSSPESTSLAEAAREAKFLPRYVRLPPQTITALNLQRVAGRTETRSGSKPADGAGENPTLYIPFEEGQWVDGKIPVLLFIGKKSLDEHLQNLGTAEYVGTIRRRPLPLAARKKCVPDSAPTFCVVVAEGESVQRVFFPVPFWYGAGLIYWVLRRRSAQR